MLRHSTLNAEQRQCVELVLAGHNVFLTGSAGTGKSFTLAALTSALRDAGKRVEVTASTGIAAVNIGGVTIHAFSGFGIGNETREELRRKANSRKFRDIWSQVDVLVLDEISMILPDYFEKLSLVTQVARQDNSPFGGLQIIAVGDFFQLPPVTKRMRGVVIPESQPIFCFETNLWKETLKHTVELKHIFRQSDPAFIECLQRIRWGKVATEDVRMLTARLNANINCGGISPTFLHSRIEDVNRINQQHLEELQTAAHTYHMVDGFIAPSSESPEKLPPRTKIDRSVFELRKNVPAEAELTLKIGSQVILLTNLSQEHKLVNGSRGQVVRFTETEPVYPIVRFANNEVVIRAYMWKKIFRAPAVYAYVAQIPLKLAYAYTIHKSQSQSIDFVQIQLDTSIFEEGQAYTALSRVRQLSGLTLSAFNPACIKANPRVIAFYTSLGQNPLQKIMSRVAQQDDEDHEDEESEGKSGEEEDDLEGDGEEDDDEVDMDDAEVDEEEEEIETELE
jgi:ATP-dependent DNA helicase PIF1